MNINEEIAEIHKRIDRIPRTDMRETLKFQFQTGTRVSEVVGKYAVAKDDMILTKYKEHEIALFNIHTAKKDGRIRTVALPVYEGWTKDIVDYFNKVQSKKVFRVSVSSLQQHAKEYFKGLNYLVEDYSITNKEPVKNHDRNSVTHYLRHCRVTEMITRGFNEADLNIFFGWMPKGMSKRYATLLWLNWSSYIEKLF